jgi:nucleoside-diphosphate-sugar epimerase
MVMDAQPPLPPPPSEEPLDELLTRPRPSLIEWIRSLAGPLVILGAGGKMGPTLAVLARRAAEAAGHKLEVIAVSRFSNGASRLWLEERNVRTLSLDLLRRDEVLELPEAPAVIYLVGLKFDTSRDPARTWATNTLIPAWVCERYPRARFAALSTGNVYPLVPVGGGGSLETDPPAPAGEYAAAALARERIFEHFSRESGTPVALLRLNYAVDLRYGVLVEIAQKVAAGRPVDITMGALNCIWQGDANDMIIRSLELAATPPRVLNLTGPQVSVREIAERFGRLLGKEPRIEGTEAPTALLSNAALAHRLLGAPATSLEAVISWTADWIRRGGRLLQKPTHFEVRDGRY